ncbi:MAG: ScyD/ScyE family protein [Opitutus sp.]
MNARSLLSSRVTAAARSAFVRPRLIHHLCLSSLLLCLTISAGAQSANVSIFATGLNNPRGLKFGPDGNLYVAEGGAAGNLSTVGDPSVEQVLPPVGPYTGGFTARISKINSNGVRTTVADHLPSSATSPNQGSLISGVGDVAFVGNTLYAILSGAGASHGLAGTDNAVLKVNSDGSTTLVANLSEFQKANPVANPEEDDFEPDGTWYGMVAVRGALYAVEPNHGELVKITTDGAIVRIADISATQGHTVPTAIAYDGNFYVGNLDVFPIIDGSSKILKITPSGEVKTYADGLTTVLGLAFDQQHRLYVLENTTGNPFPKEGTGKILRINHSGKVDEIASGLFLPTAMTFGPDGNLYVSNVGFGPPPIGLGQIVKVTLP